MVAVCKSCARSTLVAINAMFVLIGLALTALGVYALTQSSELKEESELLEALPLKTLAIVVTAVGAVITLMAVCGCVGACKRSHRCLVAYVAVLGLLVIVQLAAGVYMYTNQDEVTNAVRDEWQRDDKYEEVVAYQDWLECCNFEGVDEGRPCRNRQSNGECPPGDAASDTCKESYTDDCKKATEDWVNDNIVPIAGALIGLAVLELAGLMIGCCLACRNDKEKLDNFYHDY